jgi:hypothetical protein
METGAPMPCVQRAKESLHVTYVCRNPDFPGWESGAPHNHSGFDVYRAVLRFEGATWHHFGSPSDERLHTHPLYPVGLRWYDFWEVLESPRVPPGSPLRHWIITFHDETLEVVAASASVVSRRVDE